MRRAKSLARSYTTVAVRVVLDLFAILLSAPQWLIFLAFQALLPAIAAAAICGWLVRADLAGA